MTFSEAVPDAAKEMLAFLGVQVAQLDERIDRKRRAFPTLTGFGLAGRLSS